MAVAKLATSTQFVIEKGIPAPHKSGRMPVFPMDRMDVGDSFALPADLLSRARSCATYQQKRLPGRQFSIRQEGENYRCWRIA